MSLNLVYEVRERIRLKGTNDFYYIVMIEKVFGKVWYYIDENMDKKNSYMCVEYKDLVKIS